MASKGQKTGTGKRPAAPKTPRAPAKSAPAKNAAAKAEKPAPDPEIATPVVEAPAPEPVPAVEAVEQEEVIAAPVAEETVAETVEAVEAEAIVAEAAQAIEAAVTETVEAVEAAAETVEKETNIMVETIENTIAKTQTLFADMNERAKAAVEKNTKLVEELNDFAKGNVEALVESGKIAAKGFESLGQDAAEYSRKSFESATAALKGMAAVKSPTDFFKLQSEFVRSAFDSVVAETSKNTEAFIKLAGDAAQPISNRFAVAAEKVKKAA